MEGEYLLYDLCTKMFWDPTRRDTIVKSWLKENPTKSSSLDCVLKNIIEKILFDKIDLTMNNQGISIFKSRSLPFYYKHLDKEEQGCLFVLFQNRTKIFKIDDYKGAGIYQLSGCKISDILNKLLPRKGLLISYLKMLIECVGTCIISTLFIIFTDLVHCEPQNDFLRSVLSALKYPLNILVELDHLPAELGEISCIFSDTMKKKKIAKKKK